MTQPDIAIVGGGLLGRLLAWRASKAGACVALYDAASSRGEGSAAWAAAGMITPSAEAVDADPEIVAMGRRSLSLWPQWLAELPEPVFYRDDGTLLLWHREDAGEARRFESLLATRDAQAHQVHVDAARLTQLEPALDSRFEQSLYLPGEAQIDNRALLETLALVLEEACVQCHWQTFVAGDALPAAGIVVDCRAAWARTETYRNCVAFAAKFYASMRRTLSCATCCACCTRGFPSTWHLVLRVNWLSAPPASRVTIALPCQCAAHWSYLPLHTLCCRL